jgi:hypothetical protein
MKCKPCVPSDKRYVFLPTTTLGQLVVCVKCGRLLIKLQSNITFVFTAYSPTSDPRYDWYEIEAHDIPLIKRAYRWYGI